MTVSPTLSRHFTASRSRLAGVVSAVALVALSAGWVGGGSALAANNGEVKVDGDVIGGPGNAPHQACGLNVSFYGFDPGAHTATVTWTYKPTGTVMTTTPASGPAVSFPVAGGGDVNAPATALPFALHTAGLTAPYHVDLDVLVDGVVLKQKTIFVGACTTDVALSKSANPTTVAVGGTVTYTLTVTNNGPLNAVGFQVTDSLPAGFTLGSITAPLFDCIGAAVDCTYKPSSPPIPMGSSTSFTVTGTANAAGIPSMINTAHLNPDDLNLANNVASATVNVNGSATAVPAATPTASTCVAGAPTNSTWTVPTTAGVQYRVNGNNVVSGSVRSGLAPTVETLTAVALAGFTLTNPNFSQSIPFGAAAQNCTNATAVNAAQPTASTCVAGAPSNSTWTVPTTAGVQYRVNGSNVVSGSVRSGLAPTVETLTAVALPGFTLTNPNFSQSIPFGAAAQNCTPATAQNAAAVTASSCVANVAVPSSWVVPTSAGVQYKVNGSNVVSGSTRSGSAPTTETLTAVALPGFTLTNPGFSQTISFGALATNCAPIPATFPDLTIDKAGPAAAVKPGDNVAYTLTVSNLGNGAGTNVQVTDTLPAALTLVSASGTGWTCTGTTSVACALTGSLAPGATAVVNVVATLAANYPSSAVANTATVLPTDSNPGNNTDTESTAVTLPGPPVDEDLAISKTGLEDSVVPGDVLSWSIAVTNVAGTPAAGFTVTDVVPDGLTLITVGGTDWSCSNAGQTVTCTYTGAPLAVGSSSSFQLDSLVGNDYAGTTVSNTAVVDPGGVDATNDSATAVTPVVFTGGGGGTVAEPTPAEPAPAEGGGQALPFTGSYTDRMLSAGVVVLLLGLFLALAGRRRRTS